MSSLVGLSEGMSLAILVLLCALALPLPHNVASTLLALKPGWILMLAAASTSLVPFLEHGKALYEYRPRSDQAQSYETDPRWLSSHLQLLRAAMTGVLLLAFVLQQAVLQRLVSCQQRMERMEKNLFATQRQAKAASAQSLKMLEQVDGKGEQEQVEKLLSQVMELKAAKEAAEKEVAVVKDQAKAFNREHDRLLDEIATLEKNAAKQQQQQQDSKKDK